MNGKTTSKKIGTTRRRKPAFVVRESNYFGRIKRRWRAARGIHSKVRQQHRGRPASPTIGYGSDKEIRGLHYPTGLNPILIKNEEDLSRLDPEDGVVFSSSLGQKKKAELVKMAQEKGLKIINLKDLGKFLEYVQKEMSGRKAAREKRSKDKNKKEEEKKKKAAEKEKEEKEKAKSQESSAETVEEKVEKVKKEEEEQKKEVEKTLTKKQ